MACSFTNKEGVMKGISGFWFSPTYDCKNRCRMCYAGAKLSKESAVTLETAKSYVRQLAAAGAKSCILVGGEPTDYTDIVPLVHFMSGLGIEVRIMSNGRALKDMALVTALKQAGLHYCAVSIEGTEAVHDHITRVPGSFQESMQGLRNLITADIRCNSITTVSRYNLEIIEEVVQILRDLRVRVAAFNMCSAQPSGYPPREHNGQIDLADYARVVESIGQKYDFVRFYALIPLCLFDQAALPQLIQSGRLRVSCSFYGTAVAVDPFGNLNPCTHMPDLSYGNLNDPEAITSFLKTREIEKLFLETHAPSDKCTDCRLWTTCRGGCNLIWFARDARASIPGLPKAS
ncbi:MAG: radical SAM protein [Patescibacteria group bacterium]